MGLDGFSMGVLGLPNELTSAQMAKQAEQLAQKGTEFKIKDVTELAKENGVKRKEEQEKEQEFNDGFKKKKQKHDEEQEKKQQELLEKEFENKDPKEFSVRINPATNMVELFNNKEEKIMESISAEELMTLISKLNNASGILVNRKI